MDSNTDEFIAGTSVGMRLNYGSVAVEGIEGFGLPAAISINPANNRVYVSNAGSNTISVIDDNTGQLVQPIQLSDEPNY